MRLSSLPRFVVLGALAPLGLLGAAVPDFNREIRPILSDKCFRCHGPDEENRKGGQHGLRLDTAEGAQVDLGGGGFALVPGHPEKSELITRITTQEEDDVMPPRKTDKTLSAVEIDLLRRWIAGGASYATHWSYEKPSRPAAPRVQDQAWPRSEVDRFILARLEHEGLRPQPQADRLTLARRVALDLTGLPPSLDEVEAFAGDRSADAYERFVDRQLAKPAYGEHWARAWLDLARYADSKGYADDQPRSIWAYRDYVIDALNRNMPFDQFTIEQLAGDLLPNPTQAQLFATGFHRNTMNNTEGGTDDEEFRTVAVVDRVNTTMAVWMGTSMACAQCHTHKYDPLTQKEYFQLYAILNQTEDADRSDETPVLEFYTEEQQQQRAAWTAEIAGLERTFTDARSAQEGAAAKWAREFPVQIAWRVPVPSAVKSAGGAVVRVAPEGDVFVEPGQTKDTTTLEVSVPPGERVTAFRIESLPDASLPGQGAGGAGGNFVVTRVRAGIKPSEERRPVSERTTREVPRPTNTVDLSGPREIKLARATADYAQASHDASLVVSDAEPKPTSRGKKVAVKKGWGVGGAKQQAHVLTVQPEKPIALQPGETLVVTIEQQSATPKATLNHFRLGLTAEPRAADYVRTPAAVLAILQRPGAERETGQRDRLLDYYVRQVAPELQAERQRLAALHQSVNEQSHQTSPIMRELAADRQRKTHVQLRGNFLVLGEAVTAGVPAVFPPLPPGAPANRLTFAHWLVAPENPLTARVLANRLWDSIFGLGLVRTTEEFGSQGEPPTHPELLDWLASEMTAGQWDMKRFLRLLVTSATYRQSSKVTPEALAADPENRLLSRGPRIRLGAEMVRDQALAVSGLLSAKMYGPSTRPYQPSFDLRAAFGGALDWKTSEGADRYRRGVYTEWRRSSPYPSMVTFDAPNREVCTLRRNRTNTPLQALVTLNDPVYVEAAQSLARLIARGSAPVEDKVRDGVRRVLMRPARAAEIAPLVTLYREALAAYTKEPDQAAALITNPDNPPPSTMVPAELAAWTTVANVLLNLDEALMKP